MSLPVMTDLETWGTGPNSALLSIGAVEFDPDDHTFGREFYVVVDKQSCLDIGLEIDASTEQWWAQQSPEAKTVLSQTGIHVKDALAQFHEWFPKGQTMWGNGSDFDNVILGNAYRKAGMQQPWDFWNNRCYRTMKNMYPAVRMKRLGTHHNAVDDAKSQAMHLMNILNVMRGGK